MRAMKRALRDKEVIMRVLLEIFLAGSLLLIGCEFPPDYTELMKLPDIQRHERFRQLPIDKQIDFYLLRVAYSHPPDTSFASDIAHQGERAISHLLARLEMESDDHRKVFIIWALEQIHTDTVDLRNKPEVIKALEMAVDKMGQSDWKSMAQRSMKHIKQFAPKYAPDYNPDQMNDPPPQPPPPPKPKS